MRSQPRVKGVLRGAVGDNVCVVGRDLAALLCVRSMRLQATLTQSHIGNGLEVCIGGLAPICIQIAGTPSAVPWALSLRCGVLELVSCSYYLKSARAVAHAWLLGSAY